MHFAIPPGAERRTQNVGRRRGSMPSPALLTAGAKPATSVSIQDGSADELWAEHGWALGFRPTAVMILLVLALSLLGALSDWVGLALPL